MVGWYTVKAGGCLDAGGYLKGRFYLYAQQGGARVTWGGTDAQLCVTYPGPFNRVNTPNYDCGADERLVGFAAGFADENTGTQTINLNR